MGTDMSTSTKAATMSQTLPQVLLDLPVASRILADKGVVDAFGHISARNPDDPEQFIMSRNLAPALVRSEEDLVFYHVHDASSVKPDAPRGFLERMLHASIYKAYPHVNSVVHFHAPEVLPYGIVGPESAPFQAVYHMASFVGHEPSPIFDIAAEFGDSTDMLIRNIEQGDALARTLTADRSFVLMRGHGATVVAPDVRAAVYRAVYSVNNARILSQSLQMTKSPESIRFLSVGECRAATEANAGQADRPWTLWAKEVQ